ncbi:MAG: amidohydrolase, partial [Pedosphaera sp.]|nr:amidohydrolase [Pedosphaera sp.]
MKIFFPSYLVLGVLASLIATSAQAQLAVQGETVHTMAGEVLHDAIVLIKGGKIEAVGTKTNLRIPDGYKVVSAKVVVPGLIDAHTTVGVSGLLNQNHDQEQLDKTGPMQPELRAVDSYNSLDPLVDFVRSLGITTLHTGHGPGALISGQTFVVKTAPSTLDHAALNAATTLACTFGPGALNMGKDKAPGTVSKAMAMLRAELIKASEYKEKLTKTDVEKHPSRDLRLETLQRALEGKQPL